MMSSDVNYVTQTPDTLVREKNLRPKILVVHPFRADMGPDAQNIDSTRRVQVAMRLTGERAGGRSTLRPPRARHYGRRTVRRLSRPCSTSPAQGKAAVERRRRRVVDDVRAHAQPVRIQVRLAG